MRCWRWAELHVCSARTLPTAEPQTEDTEAGLETRYQFLRTALARSILAGAGVVVVVSGMEGSVGQHAFLSGPTFTLNPQPRSCQAGSENGLQEAPRGTETSVLSPHLLVSGDPGETRPSKGKPRQKQAKGCRAAPPCSHFIQWAFQNPP